MDVKNLDRYGGAPLEWARADHHLADLSDPTRTCWLATTDPDGRAHLTGVGALWVDGKMYFTSNPSRRKSRNLARDARCAISIGGGDMDVVIEGMATKVTDDATLEDLAERYRAQGWPARAENGALTAEFSAPSAGPPPWELYAITPSVIFAVATQEPYGATRWTF